MYTRQGLQSRDCAARAVQCLAFHADLALVNLICSLKLLRHNDAAIMGALLGKVRAIYLVSICCIGYVHELSRALYRLVCA